MSLKGDIETLFAGLETIKESKKSVLRHAEKDEVCQLALQGLGAQLQHKGLLEDGYTILKLTPAEVLGFRSKC